jgi:hypothetical protein
MPAPGFRIRPRVETDAALEAKGVALGGAPRA